MFSSATTNHTQHDNPRQHNFTDTNFPPRHVLSPRCFALSLRAVRPLPCLGVWQASSEGTAVPLDQASESPGADGHTLPLRWPGCGCPCLRGYQWQRGMVQYRQCLHVPSLSVVLTDGLRNSLPIGSGLSSVVCMGIVTLSLRLIFIYFSAVYPRLLRSTSNILVVRSPPQLQILVPHRAPVLARERVSETSPVNQHAFPALPRCHGCWTSQRL